MRLVMVTKYVLTSALELLSRDKSSLLQPLLSCSIYRLEVDTPYCRFYSNEVDGLVRPLKPAVVFLSYRPDGPFNVHGF